RSITACDYCEAAESLISTHLPRPVHRPGRSLCSEESRAPRTVRIRRGWTGITDRDERGRVVDDSELPAIDSGERARRGAVDYGSDSEALCLVSIGSHVHISLAQTVRIETNLVNRSCRG